jgi:spermidine synthase
VLWLDDVLNVTERDEFVYHEMISHVPMMTHPNPQRVLIVGGGDGGVATEVLKYDNADMTVVCVEIDEELISESREKHSATFSDPRLSVVVANATEFVKDQKEDSFDVIIVDYTFESDQIMKDCNRILASNGVLSSQSVAPMSLDKEVVRGSLVPLQDAFTKEKTYLYLIPTDTQNG